MTRAPHSRTCLALGIQSLLITLVVLYARSISSPANIPPLAVCTKTYHIEANSRTGSAQNTSAHRIPRPLLCRISSARLHCVEAIHSPRSARNAGHRFTKNSYQPFFPRSPYLFGARDIISANYTFCTDCKEHLLASQYSAFAECTTKVAL